jgi:lipopolysaccharide/colanic/teichoic acid biosynthesis glycosyltransferase
MKSLEVKRLFDLVVVVLAAPLWLLVVLVVAVLVRLKLGRPVFFRQRRPGQNGRIFELVKFRTMMNTTDATGRLLPDAIRLTPFGRWLRASSLDELPELFNVLRGEMSLVGPRPLLVDYLPRYSPRQARRHEVPPGITGLVQIKGRNSLTWEQKFEWDVTYVETRSLWLDVRILLATVVKVLRRDGISAQGDATMPEFNPPGRSENNPMP